MGLVLVLALAFWTAPAWGFGNFSGQKAGEKPKPLRGIALMGVEEHKLVPGGVALGELVVGVNPGFHLNSDQPPLDWISPTRLVFEENPRLNVEEVSFPQPRKVKFSFLDEPLPVFDKMVRIGFRVRVAESAPAGPVILNGTLAYQACDDSACLPPAKESFTLELVVGTAQPGAEKPSSTPRINVPAKASPGESKAPNGAGSGSLWLILLTTFLGGLALNLTPCVYPLIPITVAYFGGQSRSRVQLAGHGAAYLAGIAVTYTILGTFAALSGRLMGEALQHPLTLLLVAGLLLALSASMFGLYEFRLPDRLSRLGSAGAGRKGLIGTLIMGLTLGLVAAPCIGPFTLGVLTFVAQKGDVFIGAAVFLALSLGLGLPLAVLGFFSSRLMGALPQSGPWMEWIRRLLGAVLVFMAVYLLRPLIGETLWPWFGGGALALGAVLALLSGKGVHLAVRLITAGVFLAAAGYLVHDAVGVESAHWPAFSPAKLEEAKAQGRPVVLDFAADWCAPCRELAKNLADPGVEELTRKVVALQVDLTDWDAPAEAELRRDYKIRGVPTLVFIGPDGLERKELRLVGVAPPAVLKERLKALLSPGG